MSNCWWKTEGLKYVPTRKTSTRHPTIVKIVKQIPRTMRYSILNSFGSTVSFTVDFYGFRL